jgi:hypothetical protein
VHLLKVLLPLKALLPLKVHLLRVLLQLKVLLLKLLLLLKVPLLLRVLLPKQLLPLKVRTRFLVDHFWFCFQFDWVFIFLTVCGFI